MNSRELSPPSSRPMPRFTEELPHSENNLRFVRTVLTTAGLNASAYRLAPLVRRIPACLRAMKVGGQEAALQMVRSGSPRQLRLAVDALLIGTTSFFRDDAVFQELESRIVPEIVTREKSPKVWSVACSGGKELYSLSMLFASHGVSTRSRFLGTDCRAAAIETARQGNYSASAHHAIPSYLADRYLLQRKHSVSIHPELASRMEWEWADALAFRENDSQWDMILCRNLAIYLEPEITTRLWQELVSQLLPGGILVVGRAEKPQVRDLVRIGPCIYKRIQL
jgi:chemotaxis protein methyltransferase CheR